MVTEEGHMASNS